MIGVDHRADAARAILGSARSPLFPSTLWLGWHSTTGVELSAQRMQVANSDSVWGPTVDGVTNIAPIDGGAAGAWIVGGVGLYVQESDGEPLLTADLASPVTTAEGDLLTVPVSGVTFSVS